MTGTIPSPADRMEVQVLCKKGKFRRPPALALNHETTQQRTNEETKMVVLPTLPNLHISHSDFPCQVLQGIDALNFPEDLPADCVLWFQGYRCSAPLSVCNGQFTIVKVKN